MGQYAYFWNPYKKADSSLPFLETLGQIIEKLPFQASPNSLKTITRASKRPCHLYEPSQSIIKADFTKNGVDEFRGWGGGGRRGKEISKTNMKI